MKIKRCSGTLCPRRACEVLHASCHLRHLSRTVSRRQVRPSTVTIITINSSLVSASSACPTTCLPPSLLKSTTGSLSRQLATAATRHRILVILAAPRCVILTVVFCPFVLYANMVTCLDSNKSGNFERKWTKFCTDLAKIILHKCIYYHEASL